MLKQTPTTKILMRAPIVKSEERASFSKCLALTKINMSVFSKRLLILKSYLSRRI